MAVPLLEIEKLYNCGLSPSKLFNLTLEDFLKKHVEFGYNDAMITIDRNGLEYSRYVINASWLLEELKKAKEYDELKNIELSK